MINRLKEREMNLNKKLLLIASAIGALSGVLAILLLNKKSSENSLIENAGHPDTLENSEMVSEGSNFGVQYYNELKAKRNKLK